MSADEQPKIELEVKNFGPIAEAKIDLRPLTVFVGPSNTGKSFLAILLYVMQRWLRERLDDSRRREIKSLLTEEPSKHFKERSSDDLSEVADCLWGFVETVGSQGASDQIVAVPVKLASLIFDDIRALNWHYDLLAEELARCFAVGHVDELTRHFSATPARVSLVATAAGSDNQNQPFSLHMALRESDQIDPSYSKQPEMRISSGSERQDWVDNMRSTKWYIDHDADPHESYQALVFALRSLGIAHLTGFIGVLTGAAHYLPADRSGLVRSNRALHSGLVNLSTRRGGISDQEPPLLSGILADFVRTVSSIDDQPKGRRARRIGPFAMSLEANVLKGSIRVDRTEIGDSFLSYQPNGWVERLPILAVSSMVAELAPVVLYIRNLVEVGDTLIVEEPEAHLHPDAQAELASVLARLVNSGVRVVITTHSNWIVDQLANLVRMSELDPNDRTDLPGHDASLAREDVGVWMFADGSDGEGSTVTEIDFDPDGVGYEPGYLGIADKQYNTWAEINNRLADSARRV